MAMKKLFLSLSSFLLLSTTFTFATQHQQGSWQQQGQCHITRINAQDPSYRLRAEGGVSEFWNHNSDEFQCAGVAFHRHTLRSKALMLPAYHNAPLLAYILKGEGIFGVMISGCPETFESSQQTQRQSEEEGSGRRQRFLDRHQKIGQFRQGDILAIPAGAAHWAYNTGDQEFVVVVLQDTTNNANQLDQNPRSFFLAGNPGNPGQEQEQSHGSRRGGGEQRQHELGNVFRGFDVQTLAEVFGVDEETARKLQGENDERGHLIIVERGLQVITPPLAGEEYGRREEGYGGRDNGNAIMAPHWYVNAHSIVYVTRGEGRMQIVNHRGEAVFDGQVGEGKVVVVPQNFAVVKRAGDEGFEWVEFNTNDNAMINTLSGRTSAMRGLPADVVASAYQISREEAERLKFSRRETLFFSGSSSAGRGRVASA
ncbi:hypothetical protein MIMGU_mgv1a006934mg [Erythranthe guttata]|uniref:Cupin type-1 domain-containing protein n=1 Tax=Erythranthe guttata TaxID=4155 RepID=A0A022PUJ3_ERYGU|nr:hypothetical protein MIMGU_mgv1a006934mg [Erythranthe guttata]